MRDVSRQPATVALALLAGMTGLIALILKLATLMLYALGLLLTLGALILAIRSRPPAGGGASPIVGWALFVLGGMVVGSLIAVWLR